MNLKKLLIMLAFIISLQPLTARAYIYEGPEAELIMLINHVRQAYDVPPLSVNWELKRLARHKSEEMKNHQLFSHESLVYGNPSQMVERFHISYSALGANIAMGQETAKDVLEAWQGSPSHKNNIINAAFTSAGVGLSWDDAGIPYWTLILIGD